MRKVYGQSKAYECPFCGKRALSVSKQGVPVCVNHKNKSVNIKCVCGEWLDIKKGKWGPYFHCMNCGNISFRKALSMQ